MKKYILIILTMAVAYAFSSYAGTNIFVANTPRVNRNYLADLQNKFKKGVNNVYLAFSFFNKKQVKKNIAVVYPTLVPVSSNMSGKLGPTISPTIVPIATKIPVQSGFARIDPATVPANLFKSIATGVSAYEGEDDTVLLKLKEGTKYKLTKILLPDGRYLDAIDFTGQ